MSIQAIDDEIDAGRVRNRNLIVRCDSTYHDWLARLAVAARAPISVVCDQALARFAADMGFEPPPRR